MLEVHREWPLMNRFPNEDVAAESTVEEIANYCGEYEISQEYWKVHALRLGYDKRYVSGKVDINLNGWPAQFTPPGWVASESCGLAPRKIPRTASTSRRTNILSQHRTGIRVDSKQAWGRCSLSI